MVKARKKRGPAVKEEPKREVLEFEYDLVRDLPAAIERYATLQPFDAQRGLATFTAKLVAALKKRDCPVFMDAPIIAWNWLIGHAMHFSPDFCASVIEQISEIEDAEERERREREQRERDAIYADEARALREREAAEAGS